MLCVVLEQGVGPCGAVAVLIGAVRGRRARAAPDGGATGGVGDIHAVAEQLGDEACIGRLGAACAGAGELEHGLLELAALDAQILHVFLRRDLGDHVVEDRLLIELALLSDHGDGLRRADADADAAAHAVERGDSHGVLILALALAGLDRTDLRSGGSGSGLFLGQCERTDRGMRADKCAAVALDALVGVPLGDGHGDAALLVSGSAQLELAVDMIHERGDRQGIAVHLVDGQEDVLDHLHELRLALEHGGVGLILSLGPCGGDIDLDVGGSAGVDGVPVLFHNVHALLGVGMLGGVLHVLDGVGLGHDLGEGEEGGLQDGVRALAHADLDGQIDGVDRVELDVVLRDVALRLGVQVVLQLGQIPLAVDEEHAARLDVVDDLEALGDVGRVVAGNEVGLVDVVRALDGLVAEAEVRDGHAAGLLGVVLEVGLHILVGMVADDLDGVLVCADGAVAAEAPELALDGAFRSGVRCGMLLEGQVGDIVVDADGEVALRLFLRQLFIDGEDGCGRRILGTEAVAAADDRDHPAGVGQSGHDVEVERLAQGARLLRAVEIGDLLAGGRNGLEQTVGAERTVQADLHEADLLTVSVHVVDDFLCDVADGAHGDDDALCVRCAIVVEQLVVGAELGIDLAHVLLDDLRQSVVVAVAGLAMLEERVAVLVRAAHSGALGVQAVVAEGSHCVHVTHFLQVIVVPDGDLLDLMGRAEAVEEVDERDAALDGGQVRDRGEVHDFLRVGLAEHGEAGLTAGVDVGMIAEDIQRMGRDGTRGDMEDGGQQFTGDLIHVRDH